MAKNTGQGGAEPRGALATESSRLLLNKISVYCWVVVALAPELGKERQVDLCAFEASLVYQANFRLCGEMLSSKELLHRETLSQKIKTK